MAFDDLTAAELADCGARVSAAALREAQLVAVERLLAGPGAGAGVDAVAALELLLSADLSDDPSYELLIAFEKPWVLLVIRLMGEVADPSLAITEAVARGVSAPAIGRSLGVSHQAVYSRYQEAIEAGRRRRRQSPDQDKD